MTQYAAGPRSPVSDASGGDDAGRGSNLNAARQLAETVRTTLGPKGLDKMLVSDDGRVVVTNDGASIIDRLDIDHPAARLVAEVADQQSFKAGDGTTTAVVVAGELLHEAESLLERGVHPTSVTAGYGLAAERSRDLLGELTVPVDPDDDDLLRDVARTVVTGKWDAEATDFLAGLAVDAVGAIERDGRVRFERITRKTVPGGSFSDSAVVEGLVIDLEESSTDVVTPADLPRELRDATVALVDEQLSIDEPTGMGAVNPESYEDYRSFREYERDVYDGYVARLVDVGADVVFCQQSIDDPVRYGLAAEGILAVERTRRDELYKLARATGGQAVAMEDLTRATVGRAGRVERRPVGSTEVVVVTAGFDEFDQVSLLCRGGTEHVAEETRRVLDDCFHALKFAIEDGVLVPGAGAVEVELARRLRDESTEVAGREQLAVERFATALEAVPRTLARTAGMDPVDALVGLRAAHDDGDARAGLDLDARAVVDAADLGVLEPLYVKRRAIAGAAEAANLILRIDDTIPVTREGEGHGHDHEEDHEHGPGDLVHSTEGYPWALGHSMGH
ncbi:thermosome subunit alpha [Halobaculum sp. EA56]|uniref:thermosome subunit alpha n=1 Tax=Halobaculum sp. EA56 TaxID=3421648 RepID=UPI003EB85CA2